LESRKQVLQVFGEHMSEIIEYLIHEGERNNGGLSQP
jgi:hypothetical protein